MSKKLLSLFLALAMILSLVACGQKATPADGNTSDDEEIEISFMTIWAPNDDTQPNRARNAIIEEFEAKHPNVKVVNNSIPQDEFLTKIVQMSISDTLPDLFMCMKSQILTMIDNDRISPVSKYFDMIDGWEDQFIPATFDDLTVDGVPYAIPYQYQANAFAWANKAIFDKVGLEVPQTLEEVLAAAPILKAAGYTPIALGNTGAEWFGVIVLNAMIRGWVDGDWLADMLVNREAGKSWADNEGWVAAMKWLEDAGSAQAFNQDCNSLAENDAYLLYANQEAAMFICGGWFGEWLELNASDEVKDNTVCNYVPLTENSLVPTNSICAGSTWGWQISNKCEGEKLKLVTELAYMFSAEPYTQAALNEGYVRVPCTFSQDADFSNVGPLTTEYAKLTNDGYATPDYFNAMIDSELRVSFGEIFQKLLIGEITAEQALAEQQAAYDLVF